MSDDLLSTPPVAPVRSRHAARLLALRAIMDGRGVAAVVLRDAAFVAHYADAPEIVGAVLVVTAGAAVLILPPEAGAKKSFADGLRMVTVGNDAVVAAIGDTRRVGYDLPFGALSDQTEMLALGPEIARQVAGDTARSQSRI